MTLVSFGVTFGVTRFITHSIRSDRFSWLGNLFAYICFRKGKLMWGVVGIHLTPIGIIGAWRLAKPETAWAKKHYDDKKMACSKHRYGDETKALPPDAPKKDLKPAAAS